MDRSEAGIGSRLVVASKPVKKQTVDERRQEILETTCAVVIERGFAATRIADVAKRLGVSTSLIHYHYDSKEQLLAEAFSYYARKDLAELDAEIETAPNALVQLDRAIQNYVPEGSGDVEWMLWIDAWGEALRNPLMKKISQELDERSGSLLERVLRAGVASGEFRCPDPSASSARLTGLIDGLAVQFAAHNDLLTRDAFIDHVRWLAAAEVGVGIEAFDVAQHQSAAAPASLSLATDLALRHLLSTYSDAVNRRDLAAWGNTWAMEGSWDTGRPKPTVGRANIVAALSKIVSRFEWLVHVEPQALFEIDEEAGTGVGRVTVQEHYRRSDGVSGTLLGTYHDEYVRTPGGSWIFASRRLEVVDVDDRVPGS